MVGLSGKPIGTTKKEAGARGDKATSSSFNPLASFEALGAGRAPANPMEQWLSLFPTAPLFGVRWAFYDMMQSAMTAAMGAGNGQLAPMFPMAAQCVGPSAVASFMKAPTALVPTAAAARSSAEISHDVESATLDGMGSKTAKHLRLVPIDGKKADSKPAEAAAPTDSKPKPAAPAEAKLLEKKTAEKKSVEKKPAAKKKAAAPKPAASSAKVSGLKKDGSPRSLMSAKPASPDDLKLIKGVGAKLEAVLNDLGVYTYAQIAGFKDAEFDWLDERLGVSRGRPRRDDWVGQANALIAEKKKR